MLPIPRRRRQDERLEAAKKCQAEERAAARDRIIDLAATTPDPVRRQR